MCAILESPPETELSPKNPARIPPEVRRAKVDSWLETDAAPNADRLSNEYENYPHFPPNQTLHYTQETMRKPESILKKNQVLPEKRRRDRHRMRKVGTVKLREKKLKSPAAQAQPRGLHGPIQLTDEGEETDFTTNTESTRGPGRGQGPPSSRRKKKRGPMELQSQKWFNELPQASQRVLLDHLKGLYVTQPASGATREDRGFLSGDIGSQPKSVAVEVVSLHLEEGRLGGCSGWEALLSGTGQSRSPARVVGADQRPTDNGSPAAH